ncbi:MAG: EamA family transporter [Rothia sp. (in: high G+C Gram-positive bacteria)]|nr:EamA family transporter [Rothia sp. (in: high G+C Gram-positive bacteria)]
MSLADRIPPAHRGTAALLLILSGSLGIQLSTALISDLIASLGPAPVAALRALLAALVLWLLVRPNPLALTRKDLGQVLAYGLVLTLMSICFYQAVDRIPLGVAVTFEYLGAFLIALCGVRRLADGLLALLALAGVILLAGPTFSGQADPLGFLWALGSAASMAGYTLYSASMGSSSPATRGLRGTSLSLAFSALLLLPLSLPALGQLGSHDYFLLCLSALLGVALAYSADNIAGQLTSAALIGVLFSLDPVVGALVGALLLGQVLPLWSYLGILLIAGSGALLVWRTNRSSLKGATRRPPSGLEEAEKL